MSNAVIYEDDLYGWAMEQAALLRAGRLSEADVANIATEIEALGRSERRELGSRLTTLLLHLLKWHAQPSHRGTGWKLTVTEQRRRLQRHLRDNPSLAANLHDEVTAAFDLARLGAARETGLALTSFPDACPWTEDELFDEGFLPN